LYQRCIIVGCILFIIYRFLPREKSKQVLELLVRLEEYAFIIGTTTEFSERALERLDVKIVKLLELMKVALSLKTEEVMWKFVKYHLTTHTTWWIKRFGHPGQTDAGTFERLHKIVSRIYLVLYNVSSINAQRCRNLVYHVSSINSQRCRNLVYHASSINSQRCTSLVCNV
jgi:hypothetical protein